MLITLVRVLWRNRPLGDTHTHTHAYVEREWGRREMYFMDLPHMIVGTGTSETCRVS